jgi:hypothetical protein
MTSVTRLRAHPKADTPFRYCEKCQRPFFGSNSKGECPGYVRHVEQNLCGVGYRQEGQRWRMKPNDVALTHGTVGLVSTALVLVRVVDLVSVVRAPEVAAGFPKGWVYAFQIRQ